MTPDLIVLRLDLLTLIMLVPVSAFLAMIAAREWWHRRCDRPLQLVFLVAFLFAEVALDRGLALARRAATLTGTDSYWITQSNARVAVAVLPVAIGFLAIWWLLSNRRRHVAVVLIAAVLTLLFPGVAEFVGLWLYQALAWAHGR